MTKKKTFITNLVLLILGKANTFQEEITLGKTKQKNKFEEVNKWQ